MKMKTQNCHDGSPRDVGHVGITAPNFGGGCISGGEVWGTEAILHFYGGSQYMDVAMTRAELVALKRLIDQRVADLEPEAPAPALPSFAYRK